MGLDGEYLVCFRGTIDVMFILVLMGVKTDAVHAGRASRRKWFRGAVFGLSRASIDTSTGIQSRG